MRLRVPEFHRSMGCGTGGHTCPLGSHFSGVSSSELAAGTLHWGSWVAERGCGV